MLERLKTDLSLTPEEIEKVKAGVEAEFAVLRGTGTAGLGASQEDAREQARARVSKVLRTVLSPEQYKKYQELQRARPSGPRFGTIWTLANGRLVPNRVRIGLDDGSQTEIADGLKDGATVVLRAREVTP
jgi:hypothetical protein